MGSHTGCAIPKAIKMVLVAPLLTLATKRVVPGRYKKAGGYLLCVMSLYMLSVSNVTLNKASLSLSFTLQLSEQCIIPNSGN